MDGFMDTVNDIFNTILNFVLQYLPDSPFLNVRFPPEMDFFLGVVNYYIPFGTIIPLATAWASCVGIYYLYQVILRYAHAIK